MLFPEQPETETSLLGNFGLAGSEAETPVEIVPTADTNGDIVAYVKERFQRAENARRTHEERWLRAYTNYRGLYGPDVVFSETEKCRVFLKITKTKVLASYGQIIDVLFAGNKFPLGVDPSRVPEGIAEAVHLDPQAPAEEEAAPDPYGYEGDGRELPPGARLADMLGPYKKQLEGLPVKEGPGVTPTSVTIEPALVAAKKAEKKIWDQLEECSAEKHLRNTIFELVLFGTGVFKGPFTYTKEYPKWENGEYTPVQKKRPKVESTSLWAAYPDPDASFKEECEFFIERHKMSRSQIRALKRRPFFDAESIERCVSNGYNYVEKWWEEQLLQEQEGSNTTERFEVLEYWGAIDFEIAEENGIDIPDNLKDADQLQVNIWICGDEVLRIVLNPFIPANIPYYIIPYEVNPYSIFGVGVGENMDDTQTLMNGFMRMAVDNGVMSGSLIFELDETMLSPGQDYRLEPGKIFRRQSGVPGQALFAHNFPNITQQNLQMFDKARQLADESTGIPSYSHGQSGVPGVGRTAAGMSMVMGAGSVNIKTVIKNVDDYLLEPLGLSLYNWNNQFDYEEDLAGDLEVRARGTDSLLRNEVRQQRVMTFLQLVSGNPNLAVHAKIPYLLKETAQLLELDADKCVNSPAEAMIQAERMKLLGIMPPTEQGPGANPSSGPAGINPAQATPPGGGMMGGGQAPTPGEPGFSANTGQGAAQ